MVIKCVLDKAALEGHNSLQTTDVGETESQPQQSIQLV